MEIIDYLLRMGVSVPEVEEFLIRRLLVVYLERERTNSLTWMTDFDKGRRLSHPLYRYGSDGPDRLIFPTNPLDSNRDRCSFWRTVDFMRENMKYTWEQEVLTQSMKQHFSHYWNGRF
jgi:hypothetical protein